ncbi:MAG TPA: glycosyltransferase family 2 protein [Aliidongia sp.]|nr:glycosyltransferase family 2 protein [Aliidongia sp.]
MPPPPSGTLDIILVNWNSGDDLRSCVRSLARSEERALIAQVIIVDNDSIDGSAGDMHAAGLPLELDRAGNNLGFAAAANRGAARGQAPYLLFLNPDTEVSSGALGAGLRALTRPDISDRIGIVGLQLIDQAGNTSRSCSPLPTPLAFCARAFGIDRLPGFAALSPFMRAWPHDRSRIVEQVMGACFLIPRPLFESLGGFDERFFVYYEDVDLALRARQAGWLSWYETGGQVIHRGGGSSRRIPARRLFYSLSSRLRFARKHFSRSGQLLVTLATFAVEPWSRLVLALCRSGPSGASAVIGGYALLCRRRSAL